MAPCVRSGTERGAGGEQVTGAQRAGVRNITSGVDHLVCVAVRDGPAVDPGLYGPLVAKVPNPQA
jgi:hypothetical protein